jgi:hypothetical protein
MLEDIDHMIKEKLLEDLIDQMGMKSGERLKPKGLAVQVEAPDKKHLSEGLEHAKGALSHIPEPSGGEGEEGGEEDDDLSRLMEMAGKDDDDDEEDEPFKRGR